MANASTKQINGVQNISTASSLYLFENNVATVNLQKKTLISGYQYYLALFDSFIQRAAGKYSFVND